MQDLSLHFLDIFENSAKAGASRVLFQLVYHGTCLSFLFSDNGPGFPPQILSDPADPFRTSRTERPVGLGLALLKESVTAAGGQLRAGNHDGGGAEISGDIDMSHIDARPLGSLTDTIITAIVSWPRLDFQILAGPLGRAEIILDTAIIKEEIGDLPLQRPAVIKFVRNCLNKGFEDLRDWLDNLQAG